MPLLNFSNFQCSCCTFSCRSLDILAQHQRLHEKVSSISRPPSPCATSTSSIVPEGSAVPRLAPIRRNEAHYCPHCPYSTKHNCDMKAHMKVKWVMVKCFLGLQLWPFFAIMALTIKREIF